MSAEAQNPAEIGLWKGRMAAPSLAVRAPVTPVLEFPAISIPLCNTKKTGEDRHVIQRQSTSVGADRANSAAPPKTVSIAWVCLSRLPSLVRC